jgi:hypothetical protein
MMRPLFQLLIVLLFCSNTLSAQRNENLDVLHYDLQLNLQRIQLKQISGIATISAKIIGANTKFIALDLQKLQVSKITCNGDSVGFSQSDSVVRIILNKEFTASDTLSLVIQYEGAPITDSKWGGFFFSGNYAYNMGVGMGSNPVNFGRAWFPCIDNFIDRATYSFHVSTDSGFMAVCSGVQEPATIDSAGIYTWHWKLNQTIPTYLANVAVSKYVQINSSYAGLEREIPIILAVNPADTNKAKASFIRLNQAMQCFESRFGPYLFDRVGYVGVPFNAGAMEHACNISYPLYAVDGSTNYETLMAHELSHHWFGNLATTAVAGDMWLNEGWASYCEALFLECVYGIAAYDEEINNSTFDVLRNAHVRDKQYLPVSNVPLEQTYGTHVYTKGSIIAHSLRAFTNNDSLFFATLKEYLSSKAFKDVRSTDLMMAFDKSLQNKATPFFETYVFDAGHIDLQLDSVEATSQGLWLNARMMSRYKTQIPNDIPIYTYANLYYKDKSNLTVPAKFVKHPDGMWRNLLQLSNINNIAFVSIGEKPGMMLGATTQSQWVKGTTLRSFPNALISITPSVNKDSNFVHVQHHFTRPFIKDEHLPLGIRISSERYWHVEGIWDTTFKTNAFFNFDGTNSGKLDNELLVQTEDSITLLYRKDASKPFVEIEDMTKLTGGSKTDKLGRFVVNQLKVGDYVFGYKDKTALIKKNISAENFEFKAYPNPSKDGKFTFELPLLEKGATLQIFSSTGALLLSQKLKRNQKNVEVDLGMLATTQTYYAILSIGENRYRLTLISE